MTNARLPIILAASLLLAGCGRQEAQPQGKASDVPTTQLIAEKLASDQGAATSPAFSGEELRKLFAR